MKKTFFALFVAAATLLSACGSLSSTDITNAANKTANAATTAASVANTAATVANAATGTTSSDAVTNGKNAGAALKTLYSNYKSTGKVSVSGTNLLTAASLVAACTDLKNYKKGDSNYKNFAKGLLEGAVGVIDEDDVEDVMTQLVGLSGVDTSALQSTATSVKSDATTVVNSLTSIYNTLKK